MAKVGKSQREKWNAYMRSYQKSDRVRFRRQFQRYSDRERANEDIWQRNKILCGLDNELVYAIRCETIAEPLRYEQPQKAGFWYNGRWHAF